MLTDWGDTIILPGEFANEIRNEPKLSFAGATRQVRIVCLLAFLLMTYSNHLF